MAFPNLLIVGATKAGTTSVFRYLADHPAVCASSKKEINFFFRFQENLDEKLLETYQSYFKHCSATQKVRLEASPVYLSGGKWIANKINHLMPEAKLIFILRDPVERYISHFQFWLAKKDYIPVGISIRDAIATGLTGELELGQRGKDLDWNSRAKQLVRAGCYSRSLSAYLSVIPRNQICIMFFEDLSRDPKAFTQRLCEFAAIDGNLYNDYSFSIENKTRIVHFKGLHKLTIHINNSLQPILNRAPAIRKHIRSMYYLVNRETETNGRIIDRSDLTHLIEFYNSENAQLKVLLENAYPNLKVPDWLRG